jgi:hypothetical protein
MKLLLPSKMDAISTTDIATATSGLTACMLLNSIRVYIKRSQPRL